MERMRVPDDIAEYINRHNLGSDPYVPDLAADLVDARARIVELERALAGAAPSRVAYLRLGLMAAAAVADAVADVSAKQAGAIGEVADETARYVATKIRAVDAEKFIREAKS